MTASTNNPKVEEIRHSVQSSYNELNQLIAERLATLDPAKLYQRPAGNEWTIIESLAHIVEFNLELTGHHSRYGDQTLAWFIEDFVTHHLTSHLEQLSACLAVVSDNAGEQ